MQSSIYQNHQGFPSVMTNLFCGRLFTCNAAYNNTRLCPESGPPSLFLSTFFVPEHPATSVFIRSSQSTQSLQSREPGPDPTPSQTLQQGFSRKFPRQAQNQVYDLILLQNLNYKLVTRLKLAPISLLPDLGSLQTEGAGRWRTMNPSRLHKAIRVWTNKKQVELRPKDERLTTLR